jgi:hypothetical protein
MVKCFVVHPVLSNVPVPGPPRTVPPGRSWKGPARSNENHILRKKGREPEKIGLIRSTSVKEDEERTAIVSTLRNVDPIGKGALGRSGIKHRRTSLIGRDPVRGKLDLESVRSSKSDAPKEPLVTNLGHYDPQIGNPILPQLEFVVVFGPEGNVMGLTHPGACSASSRRPTE